MRIWTLIALIGLLSIDSLAQAGSATDDLPALPAPAASANTNPGAGNLPAPPQAHPAATVYSHGYEVRRNIHRYASFATLPLFATEFALGQSLYNDPANDNTRRSLHAAVGTGIIGLAGVNTFTGAWNLWGSRHDTNHRTLRILHGVLMMASDAGFVATAATAPSHGRHGSLTFDSNKVTHRNIALTSIGVGSAGYLLMLFGRH